MSRMMWLSNGKTAHRALVDFMLIRKKVFATQTFLGIMKVRDGPNLSKEGMVQGLLNMNLMMQCKGGGKTDIQFLPIFSGQVSVQDAISHRTRTCDLKLEEVYDVGKFAEYMHKHRQRFGKTAPSKDLDLEGPPHKS